MTYINTVTTSSLVFLCTMVDTCDVSDSEECVLKQQTLGNYGNIPKKFLYGISFLFLYGFDSDIYSWISRLSFGESIFKLLHLPALI